MGNKSFETPQIDKLAAGGLFFRQCYANGANCEPSRACLLSGNTTPRHEVYAVGSTNRGPKHQMRLLPVPNKNGLPVANITLADAMKAAGYATAHFGKWHLWDKQDGALPTQQGFDVSYDSFGDGEIKEGSEGDKPSPSADPKGVYTLAGKACDFMATHRDQPFFIYLAQHAVHQPVQASPEDLARIEKLGLKGQQAKFAACTLALDRSVGQILAKLEELKLTDKTLVIFTSDNGGTTLSQEPLRGSKGCYYEGGIRVPLILSWPGHIKPASSEIPVQLVDLFPSCLGLAHEKAPKELDGTDLLPLAVDGKNLAARDLFWHFPGYLDTPVERGRAIDVAAGFRTRPVSVIRRGDWKLHLFHEEWQLDGGRAKLDSNHAVELYNLKDDPGENHDLAASNQAKRDELLDALLAWIEKTHAVMASKPNPDYQPEAAGKGKKAKNASPIDTDH